MSTSSDDMVPEPPLDALPPYTHTPLTNADENLQIRLIKLERVPANDNEPVRCEIESFDLHSAPPYMWGPPTPTHEIFIDGEWLEIRENLFQFLLEYRKHELPSSNVSSPSDSNGLSLASTNLETPPMSSYDYSALYFWIDQISINQSNISERNAQVQRMGGIYTKAERVIVWLGDGSALHENYKYIHYSDRPRPGIIIYPSQSYYSVAQQFYASSDVNALVALMHHDYFSRLWIVQEVSLAREVTVMISNINISWKAMLFHYTQWINNFQCSTSWSGSFGIAKQLLVSNPADREHGDFFGLGLVILVSSAAKCFDPRDMVYGLMALVTPAHRLSIDYNKSADQVFRDVAVHVHLKYGDDIYLDVMDRLRKVMRFTTQEQKALKQFTRNLLYPRDSSPSCLEEDTEVEDYTVLPSSLWRRFGLF
jgi:hypothetical protein